ncbi:MAG TPA: protein kinase [Polyangiaceae bacterium]|nr:protein kinase [Polyangiaceae bacterium]
MTHSPLSASARLLLRGNRTQVLLPNRGEPLVRKELLPFADVSSERRALWREGYLQHLVRGPGVVAIVGGIRPDGQRCGPPNQESGQLRALERRYVVGATLRELSREPARAELVARSALDWTRRLLLVLARLHDARDAEGRRLGFIHRDVTADNVLIDEADGVWLNDFGLAHLTFGPPLDDGQLLMGARNALAPEVLAGQQPDALTDVYQAALLCVRLLAARRPLDATSAADSTPSTPSSASSPSSPGSSSSPSADELLAWCQANAELPPLLVSALSPERFRRPSAAELARALS